MYDVFCYKTTLHKWIKKCSTVLRKSRSRVDKNSRQIDFDSFMFEVFNFSQVYVDQNILRKVMFIIKTGNVD